MEYTVKDLKIIKISLLIITSVVVMFVLRLFSFIFIPLFLALFIAMLLLPLLDWFARKRVPYWIGLMAIILSTVFLVWGTVKVFQNTATELFNSKEEIISSANTKINPIIENVRSYLGIPEDENRSKNVFDIGNIIEENSSALVNRLWTFVTSVFMTGFFLSLFLTGAHLFEIYISRITDDDKDFIQIFRNVIETLNGFIKVKFFVSVLTGILFSVIVLIFGVKFALFWGVLAFILNFVQLIGSFFITTVLILFGFVELHTTSSLLLFSSLLIATQVIVGGILEPILMGKSFKINTITLLVSLSIWGFIFGVAGLVLAIPITVFLKMILETIPSTEQLARMMSSVPDKMP